MKVPNKNRTHKSKRMKGGNYFIETAKNIGNAVGKGLQGASKIVETTVEGSTLVVDKTLDTTFKTVDGALNATQIVAAVLDKTGEVGKSAVNNTGDIVVSTLDASGKIATSAIKETGEGGSELVKNVLNTTFTISNDLITGFASVWGKMTTGLKKNEIKNECNKRIKILKKTIDRINKISSIEYFIKESIKKAEQEGWIRKWCLTNILNSCKIRARIIVMIRAIFQSILIDPAGGAYFINLSLLKEKIISYKKTIMDEKKKITSANNEQILKAIDDLNKSIYDSFEELIKIETELNGLATPNMFKLRASIVEDEQKELYNNMSDEEKTLFNKINDTQHKIIVSNKEITDQVKEKFDNTKDILEQNLQTEINKDIDENKIINNDDSIKENGDSIKKNEAAAAAVGGNKGSYTKRRRGNTRGLTRKSKKRAIKRK